MRMLIVDDSRTMRNYLAAIAGELSFETQQACDGEDALQHLSEEQHFDVVLLDWDMPRMNGITVLKAVRNRRDLDGMKVVMVSSLVGMENVAEALQDGADDYLMKPFTPEMVADKLRLLELVD